MYHYLFKKKEDNPYDSSLIVENRITANQDIIGDSMTKYLHFEHVSNDLLRFFVQVGMHKSYIVIASDHVSQRGQTLFDSFYFNGIGQTVTQMLQLLVGGRVGH